MKNNKHKLLMLTAIVPTMTLLASSNAFATTEHPVFNNVPSVESVASPEANSQGTQFLISRIPNGSGEDSTWFEVRFTIKPTTELVNPKIKLNITYPSGSEESAFKFDLDSLNYKTDDSTEDLSGKLATFNFESSSGATPLKEHSEDSHRGNGVINIQPTVTLDGKKNSRVEGRVVLRVDKLLDPTKITISPSIEGDSTTYPALTEEIPPITVVPLNGTIALNGVSSSGEMTSKDFTIKSTDFPVPGNLKGYHSEVTFLYTPNTPWGDLEGRPDHMKKLTVTGYTVKDLTSNEDLTPKYSLYDGANRISLGTPITWGASGFSLKNDSSDTRDYAGHKIEVSVTVKPLEQPSTTENWFQVNYKSVNKDPSSAETTSVKRSTIPGHVRVAVQGTINETSTPEPSTTGHTEVEIEDNYNDDSTVLNDFTIKTHAVPNLAENYSTNTGNKADVAYTFDGGEDAKAIAFKVTNFRVTEKGTGEDLTRYFRLKKNNANLSKDTRFILTKDDTLKLESFGGYDSHIAKELDVDLTLAPDKRINGVTADVSVTPTFVDGGGELHSSTIQNTVLIPGTEDYDYGVKYSSRPTLVSNPQNVPEGVKKDIVDRLTSLNRETPGFVSVDWSSPNPAPVATFDTGEIVPLKLDKVITMKLLIDPNYFEGSEIVSDRFKWTDEEKQKIRTRILERTEPLFTKDGWTLTKLDFDPKDYKAIAHFSGNGFTDLVQETDLKQYIIVKPKVLVKETATGWESSLVAYSRTSRNASAPVNLVQTLKVNNSTAKFKITGLKVVRGDSEDVTNLFNLDKSVGDVLGSTGSVKATMKDSRTIVPEGAKYTLVVTTEVLDKPSSSLKYTFGGSGDFYREPFGSHYDTVPADDVEKTVEGITSHASFDINPLAAATVTGKTYHALVDFGSSKEISKPELVWKFNFDNPDGGVKRLAGASFKITSKEGVDADITDKVSGVVFVPEGSDQEVPLGGDKGFTGNGTLKVKFDTDLPADARLSGDITVEPKKIDTPYHTTITPYMNGAEMFGGSFNPDWSTPHTFTIMNRALLGKGLDVKGIDQGGVLADTTYTMIAHSDNPIESGSVQNADFTFTVHDTFGQPQKAIKIKSFSVEDTQSKGDRTSYFKLTLNGKDIQKDTRILLKPGDVIKLVHTGNFPTTGLTGKLEIEPLQQIDASDTSFLVTTTYNTSSDSKTVENGQARIIVPANGSYDYGFKYPNPTPVVDTTDLTPAEIEKVKAAVNKANEDTVGYTGLELTPKGTPSASFDTGESLSVDRDRLVTQLVKPITPGSFEGTVLVSQRDSWDLMEKQQVQDMIIESTRGDFTSRGWTFKSLDYDPAKMEVTAHFSGNGFDDYTQVIDVAEHIAVKPHLDVTADDDAPKTVVSKVVGYSRLGREVRTAVADLPAHEGTPINLSQTLKVDNEGLKFKITGLKVTRGDSEDVTNLFDFSKNVGDELGSKGTVKATMKKADSYEPDARYTFEVTTEVLNTTVPDSTKVKYTFNGNVDLFVNSVSPRFDTVPTNEVVIDKNAPALPVVDLTYPDRTPVVDLGNWSPDEIAKIKKAIEDANEGKGIDRIDITPDGVVTVHFTDGHTQPMEGTRLVSKKPMNEIYTLVYPEILDVDNVHDLTPIEKGYVANRIKGANPNVPIDLVTVGANGDTTVTFTDKSESPMEGTRLVRQKPFNVLYTLDYPEVTLVNNVANVSTEEQNTVADKIKAANEGKHIESVTVDTSGNATVVFEDKTEAKMEGTRLVRQKPFNEVYTLDYPEALPVNDVKDLTLLEKSEVVDRIKGANPDKHIKEVAVDSNGDTVVTFDDDTTSPMEGSRLVKEKPKAETV